MSQHICNKYDEDDDLIPEVIIEHLDGPDIYNLRVGKDYFKRERGKQT